MLQNNLHKQNNTFAPLNGDTRVQIDPMGHAYLQTYFCINIKFCIFEKVKTFKYLGSLLTNQNSIQEEIKHRLKAENSCYYSVQKLLSSRLLSKNLKIKIYKTIILPVVLYGCEA